MIIVVCDLDIHVNCASNTHAKEFVSYSFCSGRAYLSLWSGHTKLHVFILDLTLSTDDVFSLTQCYSQCHYLKDRHSKILWHIGHKRYKSLIIFYSVFNSHGIVTDLSNNLFHTSVNDLLNSVKQVDI